MSSGGSSQRQSAAAPAGRDGAAPTRPLHPHSFKLRFAPQREPGRSYVSLVKPFALPATVTDKFYTRTECEGGAGSGGAGSGGAGSGGAGSGGAGSGGAGAGEEGTARALQRIQDMFTRGPRDKYVAPLTSAHEYGWWWDRISTLEQVPRTDRRLHHHIHDSQWLKECLRVLAADDKLKQT